MENTTPKSLADQYLDYLRSEGRIVQAPKKTDWFHSFLENFYKGFLSIPQNIGEAVSHFFIPPPESKPETSSTSTEEFKRKAVELGRRLKREGKSQDEIEREIEDLAKQMGVELY